jgi:nucleotide-binding universal stress UspA family protein
MTENHTPSIVVGIDGSKQSLAALRWALREGVSRTAAVEVVHCWQPQTLTDLAFGTPRELSRGSLCMLDGEVAAALSEMTVKPVVVQTSIHGRPATALLNRATHAQLLVLGSHGQTGLRDVVFGKVEASCTKHAGCPVVVVDANDDAVTRGDPGVAIIAS